jgi:TPR repeat protein
MVGVFSRCVYASFVVAIGACAVVNVTPTLPFPHTTICGSAEACDRQCTSGDAAACGIMSEVTLYGVSVPRDPGRTLTYAQRGCAGNDGRSCATLAICYRFAVGTAQDLDKSREYNGRSCDVGVAVGCNSFGMNYRDGIGVDTKDPVRATQLFVRSCTLGSALGCGSLAREMPDGMVPEDLANAALPVLVRDCDPNRNPDPRVCTVAAKMYAAGRGAPSDPARARVLFDAGCKHGDSEACAVSHPH